MNMGGLAGLKTKSTTEVFKWAAFLLIVMGVSLSVYLIWFHHGPGYAKKSLLRSVEDGRNPAAQDALKTGDYSTYQATEYVVANNYLGNNDIADAERVVNTVFAKVPAAQLDSGSYDIMIRVQLAKHDIAKAKHYYQLLIKLLKAQGDTVGAKQAQQDMDKLP